MNPMEAVGRVADSLACTVSYQEPMQSHTTFKIGGPSDLFVKVQNQNALSGLLKAADEMQVRWQVIGKGSNLLVDDQGIRGMVLELSGEFSQIQRVGENQILCGAAVSLAALCWFAQKEGLTGLEFAYGIPGTVGGAVFMNAGAYGSEMKNVLLSGTHMTADGTLVTLTRDEMDLSYRHSTYQGRQVVIVSALLQLTPGRPDEIRRRMEDILQRRKDKQPLEQPSAGSVFKRPQGHFAGTLIEQCGLKGRTVGGAMVSPKHAGFIVNTGGATCRDVLDLIAVIQQTVKKETGVSLECEIKAVK